MKRTKRQRKGIKKIKSKNKKTVRQKTIEGWIKGNPITYTIPSGSDWQNTNSVSTGYTATPYITMTVNNGDNVMIGSDVIEVTSHGHDSVRVGSYVQVQTEEGTIISNGIVERITAIGTEDDPYSTFYIRRNAVPISREGYTVDTAEGGFLMDEDTNSISFAQNTTPSLNLGREIVFMAPDGELSTRLVDSPAYTNRIFEYDASTSTGTWRMYTDDETVEDTSEDSQERE